MTFLKTAKEIWHIMPKRMQGFIFAFLVTIIVGLYSDLLDLVREINTVLGLWLFGGLIVLIVFVIFESREWLIEE